MNLKDFVRLHKKQSSIAGVVVAIFFVFYFIFFFSVGMRFGESFFTKSVENGTAFYIGLLNQSKTNISVSAPHNSVTTVTYQVQDGSKKTYLVTLDKSIYDSNTNYPIHITDENGKELFDGNLLRGQLFNKNGELVFDDRITSTGAQYFYGGDTLNATEITGMALYQYDTIRGNPVFLTIAVLLFLLDIFDMLFPLALFSIRHGIEVEDPQPSDWYLTVQKTMQPIIALVGLMFLISAILV